MAGEDNGSLVGFIRGISQRRAAANIEDAQRNYLTDPQGAIAAVNQVSGGGPEAAYQLKQRSLQDQQQQLAMTQAAQERAMGAVRNMAGMLQQAQRSGADIGQAYDSLSPVLTKGLGMSPDEVAQWRQRVTDDPTILSALARDPKAKLMNISAGAAVFDPNTQQEIYSNPGLAKPLTIKRGDGGTDMFIWDPESRSFVQSGNKDGGAPGQAPAGGGGAMTVANVAPHIVAQESGGDYTATNKDTGALGAYQIMPNTARSLASRLGVPYNSGLMVSDTPEGRAYQDKIGQAAIQEALDNSNGNPQQFGMYYYGGSDKSKWGPKTMQYGQQMAARISGGAPAAGQPAPVYSSAGKPAKDQFHVATAAEKQAAGVDPNLPFQVGPDGKMVPIGPTGKGSPFAGNKLAGQMGAFMEQNRQVVNESIDKAIKAASDSVAGGLYAKALRHLPGSAAYDFAQTLDTIRSNIGFDKLQDMRNNSPTGGALGQVSDLENKLLQAALGSIDPDQSVAQLTSNLKRLKQAYATFSNALKKEASTVPEGTIIRNPTTGARKVMRNGNWQDLQ